MPTQPDLKKWLNRPPRTFLLRGAFPVFLLGLIAATICPSAQAYTPKSPKVQAAIARGIEFLESDESDDNRVGAKALVGIVLLKNEAPPDHRLIVETVGAIRKAIEESHEDETVDLKDGFGGSNAIYSLALSTLFLITLDPNKYAPEIEMFLDTLELWQKNHGGWGYLIASERLGDTSMTQYVVLCYWEARQAGFDVPMKPIERVATWLLKTQDPSGQWGYKGVASDSFKLIPQSDLRHSMAAAGLGSLYICVDMLGVNLAGRGHANGLLPAALRTVGSTSDIAGLTGPTPLTAPHFRDATKLGDTWFEANFVANPPRYPLYYLYALERYKSFSEAIRREAEPEPAWYNEGVEYLLSTQASNGSWIGGNVGPTPNTTFALLFLLRSTRRSIEKVRGFGDGTMLVGRGLPKNTSMVTVRRGKVVARPTLGPAQRLLTILDTTNQTDYEDAAVALAELPPQDVAVFVSKNAAALRRLATDPSPHARLAAVRALAKGGDLDDVPALIYALTDPDRAVAIEARDALRRIARRPRGLGLPDQSSMNERRNAAEQWKTWCRTFRPNAKFIAP